MASACIGCRCPATTTAAWLPPPGQVQRRIRQYRALTDEATCLRLAKALAHAKVEGQHRYLLRASRGEKEARAGYSTATRRHSRGLRKVPTPADRDSLRGYEGIAAVQYFEALRLILGDQVSPEFRFDQRNRRPPLDRFNAILSFGYGLLHTAVMRAVLAMGLEPAFGFFHTPRSAAYPLVLDLMELFRVVALGHVGCRLAQSRAMGSGRRFHGTRAKVWLSDEAARKRSGFSKAGLRKPGSTRSSNYSLSYARTIELESPTAGKRMDGRTGPVRQARLHNEPEALG